MDTKAKELRIYFYAGIDGIQQGFASLAFPMWLAITSRDREIKLFTIGHGMNKTLHTMVI
jgi:hypothetical protein